ncbi:MAG: hypothetical protein ACRDD7_01210 [Peptostreptococcaceae bacterium]
MKCNTIHETVIRDIIDVIDDVRKSDELKGFRSKDSFRSVAQASSNLTLVFPQIVSRNISIDNAAMITKAMERKAVSMLQILFSALSISSATNGVEFINKIHKNLNLDNDMTIDNFIGALDKFVLSNESVTISDMELYKSAKSDLLNLSTYLPESINENSISDFKVYPQSFFGESTIILENKKDLNITVNMPKDSTQTRISRKDDSESDRIKSMKTTQDMIKQQLMDSDVKKANELVPTMMIVNFISTAYDESIKTQFVVGVKAKMYPVDSVDIMNRIKLKNQDKNGMVKFIKATTREISFCRDFMFAVEKAKLDALSQSKKGSSSKMWKILERRGLKSRVRRTLGQINDASAITTLVVSQEEVEYMKKTENINLEDIRTSRIMLESYNLMGICIVDEASEVAKFIFDTGDDIYENISFTHLERESSDGSYKKVINLISKMR